MSGLTATDDSATLVSVGIVASNALVTRVLRTADGWLDDGVRIQLVPLVYEHEEEAAGLVAANGDDIDAALFAGPLSYDIARAAGALAVPATYLSVAGSALHAALLRLVRRGVADLGRISVDSFSEAELARALAEADIDPSEVKMRPYKAGAGITSYLRFHRASAPSCSAALTSLPSVARELSSEGIVAELLRPTDASIRAGVHSAALLGAARVLGDTKPAQVVVAFNWSSSAASPTTSDALARDQARTLVRASLTTLCLETGMSLRALESDGFLLGATHGLLQRISATAPATVIAQRVRHETGMSVNVGVGVGERPLDAERRAFHDLKNADEESADLPVAENGTGEESFDDRAAHLLAELNRRDRGSDIVDVIDAADLLGVSERTARRLLNRLAESGRAWRLPVNVTGGRGRPRRQFRLVIPPESDSSNDR
ncbi:hypothetical protein GCM10028798_35510 [Humibacter antri]